MWVRISEVAQFHYISDFLVGYRRHSGQQSLQRRQWEDGFTILKDACARHSYGLDIKRKRLAVLYYRFGQHDFRQRQFASAAKNFFLAGLLDPVRATKFLMTGSIKCSVS
ncbi:MAG: hypothetical protein C4B57_03920 [Deltaproteobacteria bacterium]|nr:MAG: hypothetical protein C4B57_03920 [Deltaproteobacteria bacterium]